MRYYEDIVVGEQRESTAREISREEILGFARRYDPQYFHADEQAAGRSIFGDIVASGVHTIAIWRQLDHEIAADIAWICGVAWDEVRWPEAVRPGDRLQARHRCLDKRPSGSDPRRGVVVFEYTLWNQHGALVFTCRSTNLIERRHAEV